MHSSVHPRPSEQRIVAQTRGTPSALPRGGGCVPSERGWGWSSSSVSLLRKEMWPR